MRTRLPFFGLRITIKTKTKIFEFGRATNMAFTRIYLKSEFSFYPCCDTSHHSFSACLTTDRNDTIIGVTNIAKTTTDEFLIKFVQHDVAQQGRKVTALRSTFVCSFVDTIFHYTRFQILAYQTFGVRVTDDTTDIAHQLVLGNFVEELFQINVNYPFIAIIQVFKKFKNGLLAITTRTKAIAMFLELRLEDGRKDLDDGLLDSSVQHGRDAKFTHTSVPLGYLNPTHWGGLILAFKDGLLDTIPIRTHVFAKLVNMHAVNAHTSLFGENMGLSLDYVLCGENLFD